MEEKDPRLVISEAYALLARAFKKLKGKEEDPVKKSSYGELAQAYRKLRARAKEEDAPPPATFSLPWKAAEDYMGSQKVLWGCNFDSKFCNGVIRGNLRADRFKNRWLRDVNARRGWRSITQLEFRIIFDEVYEFHGDCMSLFQKYGTRVEWLDKVGFVNERQWDRRHLVMRDPNRLSFKLFINCCCHEHKRLAPLRG